MSCNESINIFLLGLASSIKTDIRTSEGNQQHLITFAYTFCVTTMVILSSMSNIISIDTFRHATIRSTTDGTYLLICSCCSLFGIIMPECRLFQLIDSLTYISFFFICNIISGLASLFTRIRLWLNGLTTLQRSLHSFEYNRLINQIHSRVNAPKLILGLILILILMHIPEFYCRVTLPDPVAQGKFVCQIIYSKQLLILNEIFTFFHLFIPFLLHIMTTCLIIALISHRRVILQQTTYSEQ